MSDPSGSNAPKCLAVGLDIGSCMARVALCSDDSIKIPPTVVSNPQGHRATPVLVTTDHAEEDEEEKMENKGESFVFGEAALRMLQKRKQNKQLDRFTVQHFLSSFEGDTDKQECSPAATAFFLHLCTMAADTSAVPAENLRVVLSVPTPVDGDDEKEEAASVEKSIATIQQAWKSLLPKTKANKKKQVVVGVLTDAAAVCVAHGITDLASKQEKQYNNVLVVDWGASGLTLTQFRSCGNTGMLQQVTSQRESSIKASIFVETMAKFVASQFERKNRFPSGEVFENSKARTKLITSCETALKTMSNSKTSNAPVHVTIDGLYEGTDCHIPISKPRWDMLTSSFLKKAQAMLEAVMFDGDAVLVAGSVVSMPKAQQIINETFATCYRGLATIPPEEAVAMGCARQGAQVLALLEDHPEVDMKDISKSPSRPNVPLSPVSLGVGCCKEEPKMVATLVDNGTPLPAHSKHVFDVQAQEEYGVYQMTPSRKLVAKLEGLPETGQVEIMVELSAHGVVSLSVQGGPLVRIV